MTRRSSPEYSRIFSLLAAGSFLLVTGVIGLDVSHLRGWFAGMKWVDAPVWWQIGLGTGLLVAAAYFIKRLPRIQSPFRRLKHVGSGKSKGAQGSP